MTRLAFDIYGPTYPVSTTRLTRVTEYGPGTTFRPRRPMGSGLLVVAKGQDFVTATNFAIGNYVIVRDLDISEVSDSLNVLGGFYLEEGDFSLVTDRTKWLRFGGRSTISVLQRAIMGNESLSPFEGPSSIVDGYWRWGSDTYGGIMRRALFEANLQDPPGLPQIDTAWIGSDNIFWNDDDDSNGDPWPSFAGEFRTQCGTSLLDLYGELYGYGVELEIDARTFDLYAYNTDGYGTDRTGAFAAGNVRFETGVNIVSKIGGVALTRSIHGTVRTTHLLVRTTDHPEGVFIESDDYTPGDPVYKRAYQSGDISGDPSTSTALEARAQRNMDLRQLAEDAVRFLMRPGDDEAEGLYVAGPNYTPGPTAIDAHVWTGDLITLESGSDTVDYNEATKRVEGFDFELVDGGWLVWILTGARFLAPGSITLSGSGTATLPINLCGALDPGTETVIRRYTSDESLTTDFPGLSGATVDAAWDSGGAGAGISYLVAAPDDSQTSSATTNRSDTGDIAGLNAFYRRYGFELDADAAAIIAAGGATIRGQFQANARHGVGINEAGQDMIAQIIARITDGESTTFRGNALDAHALASSAGSSKWPASSTERNKQFPPAAASNVLTAVPGTVAGDFAVFELGSRNFTLSSKVSGGTLHWNSDSTSAPDLPEDDLEAGADFNPWIEIRGLGAATGTGLNPDLVGTDLTAARCDHTHHVISNRDPSTADDIAQGFPNGTLWTNTDTGSTYLLIDEDAGTWLLIAQPSGSHTHEPGDIIPFSLDALEDVDTSTVAPSDGDVLTFDTADDLWKPAAAGSGGAPTTADYLVGTAQGGLSAEIVVGTSPGGELGGTWASPTIDATHAGSNHLQPVRKNSTGSDFTRRRLNLIEGSNITLTVADDAGNDEVDITITAAGSTAPTFVSIAKWGTD